MKLDLTKPAQITKALKAHPVKKPIELTDNTIKGLTLRCRRMPDGTTIGSFGVRIMVDGKAQRVSLGDYASLTGAEARAAALAARQAAEQGATLKSHRAAAKEARLAAEAAKTQAAEEAVVEAIANTSLYDLLFVDVPEIKNGNEVKQEGRVSFDTMHWQKIKSGDGASRAVRNLLGDTIHQPALGLTAKDLEAAFLRKADTAPHAATRAVAYLRPALNHLSKRGLVPMGLLDLCEDHAVATVRRDRVLTKDEWTAVWHATDAGTPAHNAVRILALTGARNREVAGMTPDELHLDKNEWHLPTDRSKNSDAHIFTLCPRAVEIIRSQLTHNAEIGRADGPVFSTDGESPVWLGSKVKNAIDTQSGVEAWRFHDLRRSFATGLAESGVSAEVVDRMLNHRASSTMGGVAGIYNKSQRLTERHAASQIWGQTTDQWIDGTSAKVIKIG